MNLIEHSFKANKISLSSALELINSLIFSSGIPSLNLRNHKKLLRHYLQTMP